MDWLSLRQKVVHPSCESLIYIGERLRKIFHYQEGKKASANENYDALRRGQMI